MNLRWLIDHNGNHPLEVEELEEIRDLLNKVEGVYAGNHTLSANPVGSPFKPATELTDWTPSPTIGDQCNNLTKAEEGDCEYFNVDDGGQCVSPNGTCGPVSAEVPRVPSAPGSSSGVSTRSADVPTQQRDSRPICPICKKPMTKAWNYTCKPTTDSQEKAFWWICIEHNDDVEQIPRIPDDAESKKEIKP